MKLAIDIRESARPTTPATIVSGLLDKVDVRNLCLLLLGFSVVLALVPPVRSYPMSDDWAYAQSVSGLLHLTYRPHDWTQPTSLGHLVWGALFSLIFGYNFKW